MIALVFIAVAITETVYGDSPAPPSTYTTISPGGEYIFVMLAPGSFVATETHYPQAEQLRRIREKYKQSGLYRNDGSTDALWTVDWYAFSVAICSDGVHLVRPGPWPSTSRQEAVSFFAGGKLLKSYRINQLVDLPILMPRSISHFAWRAAATLNDDKKIYHLRTLHGETYRFDVTTGRITFSFRPPRWILGVGICVLVWRRRMRRRLAPHSNRTGTDPA